MTTGSVTPHLCEAADQSRDAKIGTLVGIIGRLGALARAHVDEHLAVLIPRDAHLAAQVAHLEARARVLIPQRVAKLLLECT